MSLRGAILGFLALEPMSGYTLKQRFDGSVQSFWSSTQSQIYRELHALEKAAAVRVSVAPGEDGRPNRKVYALTPAGKKELRAWLTAPLEPLQLRHPLLLKLVFASELPPDELDGSLAGYESATANLREELSQRMQSPAIFALARSKREAEIWRLSIEHGLDWCDMELAWIARARKRLGKGDAKWTRKAKS